MEYLKKQATARRLFLFYSLCLPRRLASGIPRGKRYRNHNGRMLTNRLIDPLPEQFGHLAADLYLILCNGFDLQLFSSVPEELYESARLDGAGDFWVYRSIYMHIATLVLATVLLFTALGYWNDWWLGLMLVDRSDLQPLQMLLRNIVSNIQYLQTMESNPQIQQMLASIPGDGVKMALVIITTGPILLLYPFVQRYFVKGIMVGAVKG